MRFVGLMAVREMRSSWKRLLFFFICIAIGVGAIVALRSVIQSVRNTFAGEARSLIAADAIINSNQPLKPEVTAEDRVSVCSAAGAAEHSLGGAGDHGPAADRTDGRARMVELRAVEEGFPYYGRMKLADGVPYDHALLQGFGVLVRPELLAQLRPGVGDAPDHRLAAVHDSRRASKRSPDAASAPSASARACSSTWPISKRPA